MVLDTIQKTAKDIKFTPYLVDFFCAINKVKHLDGVVSVDLFPTNNKDFLNIYVTVKEETSELNNSIFDHFVDWQEDYLEFMETHILTEQEKHYIPKEAFCL